MNNKQPLFKAVTIENNIEVEGFGWFETDYTDEFLNEKGLSSQNAMVVTDSGWFECHLDSVKQVVEQEPIVEIWKDIEGYENLYQVSNIGRVRSLDRLGDNGRQFKGVIKKLADNGKGYQIVNLKVKGKQKNKYVHRLVAEAFIPNLENKPEVNHIDGNKANNLLTNLEWTTRLENVTHSFKEGLNRNAGGPKKVYVFDGDNTIVYNSRIQFSLHMGKDGSWCNKRFENTSTFIYKGLTVSDSEIEYGNKIIFDGSDKGKINDGYHSVEELYYHRMKLFALICNTYNEDSWKSKLHNDGTMYDNYFIVGITTEKGDYTYHYHMDYWDEFNVKELQFAPPWDGHKPEDIDRINDLLGSVVYVD